MFKVGDPIVYPMHGAGTIESIEERQILGENRLYYIIRIKIGNMQVMVPVNGCEAVGLRSIMSKDEVQSVYDELASKSTEMDENWNRRNRDNMEKLKTGNPVVVAGVIRNLVRVDRIKKLSTGEKKLLSNAKQILASEFNVVLGMSQEEAVAKFESLI